MSAKYIHTRIQDQTLLVRTRKPRLPYPTVLPSTILPWANWWRGLCGERLGHHISPTHTQSPMVISHQSRSYKSPTQSAPHILPLYLPSPIHTYPYPHNRSSSIRYYHQYHCYSLQLLSPLLSTFGGRGGSFYLDWCFHLELCIEQTGQASERVRA